MSGAQSWSVKGIDPKVREAAREAAARQGMSLGEYLNHALAGSQPSGNGGAQQQATPPRQPRSTRYVSQDVEGEDDWAVATAPRTADPTRLAQRVESIERRTQLAVTGLDRAVSTIDRSVLGLAARVEDAEAATAEAADRIAEALDQFRAAGETLSGKLARAEQDASQSKAAFEGARREITDVRQRLEHQVTVAEEVARRAEAAASYLTQEMEGRDTSLQQTLVEARAVAEEAARQASEASADAVSELRRLQEDLSDRLAETQTSTRRAIESAVAEVRNETSGTREALLEEVVRLENEITKRVGSVEQLRNEHTALISRIERAEQGARETTAGLRQAAGAAIADLRNSQLTLAARLKQVEDVAGASGAVDVSDLRHAQHDIAERLAALETKTDANPVSDALAAFERRLALVEGGDGKLTEVDGAVKTLDDALNRLSARIAETETTANTAIRTLEETVSSLGARVEQSSAVQETEAVRALLEQRLDTMAQSVSQMVGEARLELQTQLAAALEGVAGEGLEGALADVNRRLASAERRQAQTIEAISLEIRRMSETVDKRLRAVETRNDDAAGAAVREELSKMASTLEQRFDEIERREAAAFDRMGLEVGRLSERLEERVGAVEVRSAQAIEQVGEQVARMADRFNHRQDALARELGERMLDSEERSGARVSDAINSIMQRLTEVEEHSAEAIAPVQKAVSNVATKLQEFESGREPTNATQDALPTPTRRYDDFPMFDDLAEDTFAPPAPQAAETYVSPMDAARPLRAGPLPSSPTRDIDEAPLTEVPTNDDIYFAEDDINDLLEDDDDTSPVRVAGAVEEPFTADFGTPLTAREPVVEDAFSDDSFEDDFKSIELSPDDDLLIDEAFGGGTPAAAATPPPQDDDPFWSPETTGELPPLNASEAAPLDDIVSLDDTVIQPALDATAIQEPEKPAGKYDYLANARRAAQAQTQVKTSGKTKTTEPGATPKLSLRGSSRIVLWGAASLVAAMVLGGAWYINQQPDATPAAEPQQDTVAPTATAPDPNATFEAPPEDPFAAAPAEGLAPTTADPAATPIASNATPTSSVVAGPLPARNVSLEQAAQAGDLTAQYELGLQRLAARQTQAGVALLRRAADRGFAMAQYRLAKIYERGEGVQADLTVARQWTERAAASGNRRAMHDLGVFFARGEGAPLDEAAAFRWFRQAAELGVADSQYNLGVLYQQGRGVNASPSEALFWFLVAARQGDQDAGARATALEGQLQPNQVEQARARAQAFRPRAASAIANGEFGPRPWAAARPAT
jgi:localization factor PodJL